MDVPQLHPAFDPSRWFHLEVRPPETGHSVPASRRVIHEIWESVVAGLIAWADAAGIGPWAPEPPIHIDTGSPRARSRTWGTLCYCGAEPRLHWPPAESELPCRQVEMVRHDFRLEEWLSVNVLVGQCPRCGRIYWG